MGIAKELALNSTILLKNTDALLPLDAAKITSIAIFGKDAVSDPLRPVATHDPIHARLITR